MKLKEVGLLVALALSAGGGCTKATTKNVSEREIVAVVSPGAMKTYVVAEHAIVHFSAGLEVSRGGASFESSRDEYQLTVSVRADVDGKLAFNDQIWTETHLTESGRNEHEASYDFKACAHPAGAVLLYKNHGRSIKEAVTLFRGRPFRYHETSLGPWPACEEIASRLPPAPDLVAVSSGGEDACRALADANETRAWVRCRLPKEPRGSLVTSHVDERVDAAVAGGSEKEPAILFYADVARGEKNSPDVEAMVYETLLDSAFPVGPHAAYHALCFTPSRQRRLRYLENAMARCRQGTLSDEAKGSAEVAAMLLEDKAMVAKVRKACAAAKESPDISNLPKYRRRLK
jgi:hypothetical protein